MDYTAATTAIAGAGTDVATVFGSVVLVIVAIFGIKKVYSLITKS
jgi:hypothetical protein